MINSLSDMVISSTVIIRKSISTIATTAPNVRPLLNTLKNHFIGFIDLSKPPLSDQLLLSYQTDYH